jgi:hypothetical protein
MSQITLLKEVHKLAQYKGISIVEAYGLIMNATRTNAKIAAKKDLDSNDSRGLEAKLLKAIVDSLVEQEAPPGVSGYSILNKLRPILGLENEE